MYIYVICVIKDKIKKTPTEIQKGMRTYVRSFECIYRFSYN